ncbi:MAG TPA: hypothetical protein EYN91_10170 [Candidatus Melainabacteria bacterium]|nr:hypothetical protein [Candidatus Melainabacteria bacterium]HIN64686.1 hypothetical protein [Candidatus Obscuribacterales bacterium]
MRIVSKVSSSLLASSLAILGLVSTSGSAFAQNYQNWYPRSITPPNGYQYPCALTALPDNLQGVPVSDRQFINHIYSLILKALQAKMVMLSALNGSSGFSAAYATYYSQIAALRAKILAEPTPGGLETFRAQVVSAIDNQCTFFDKAQKMRQQGTSFEDVMQVPEGRTASQMLMAAWNEMAKRYPSWSPEVKDSIYHHLCALDLF